MVEAIWTSLLLHKTKTSTWWGNYWLLYKAITKNPVGFLHVTLLEVLRRSGRLYSIYWRCRLQKCEICVINLLKALWRSCASVAIVSWQRNSLSFEELPSKLLVNNFQVELCLLKNFSVNCVSIIFRWKSLPFEELSSKLRVNNFPVELCIVWRTSQ